MSNEVIVIGAKGHYINTTKKEKRISIHEEKNSILITPNIMYDDFSRMRNIWRRGRITVI